MSSNADGYDAREPAFSCPVVGCDFSTDVHGEIVEHVNMSEPAHDAYVADELARQDDERRYRAQYEHAAGYPD